MPRDRPVYVVVLERVSVSIGLLALIPLTRFWDRDWWVRLLLALAVVALVAVATRDVLPGWIRRRSAIVATVVVVSVTAALAPAAFGRENRPTPDTVGRATISNPDPGQSLKLPLVKSHDYTYSPGFEATGTCTVPPGYRAMIVSRAADGSGYWVLSDGILGDCVDDGVTRQWTAKRVDPSWPGMKAGQPVTLGVTVLRRAAAERAQVDKEKGKPLRLPLPVASVKIFVTRIEP